MRRVLWLTLMIAVGAVALLDATIFVGQPAAQQPGPAVGGGALQAQTSLAQAIRVAEQQTGGRAKKAELERDRGVYMYEIKTVSKDGSAKVVIDPASGNVVRTATPWFPGVLDRDDQRKDQAAFARLSATSMTLTGAIDAAEKATGGRAVQAELKSRYGATLFEVKVLKDWVTQKILVDPATARAVTVSQHGDHDDDNGD